MSKNNKKNTVFLKKLICALLPGLLIETVGVVIAALFVYQTGIIYLYYLFCVFAFFAAFAASYSFQKRTAIKGLFSGLIFGTLFSIIFVGIMFVFRESLVIILGF